MHNIGYSLRNIAAFDKNSWFCIFEDFWSCLFDFPFLSGIFGSNNTSFDRTWHFLKTEI